MPKRISSAIEAARTMDVIEGEQGSSGGGLRERTSPLAGRGSIATRRRSADCHRGEEGLRLQASFLLDK